MAGADQAQAAAPDLHLEESAFRPVCARPGGADAGAGAARQRRPAHPHHARPAHPGHRRGRGGEADQGAGGAGRRQRRAGRRPTEDRRAPGAGRQRGLQQREDQRADRHGDLAAAARLGHQAVHLPGRVRDARLGEQGRERQITTDQRHRAAGLLDAIHGDHGHPHAVSRRRETALCARQLRRAGTWAGHGALGAGEFVQYPGGQGAGACGDRPPEGDGEAGGHHDADAARLRPVVDAGRRRCDAAGDDRRVCRAGQRRGARARQPGRLRAGRRRQADLAGQRQRCRGGVQDRAARRQRVR